MSVNLKNKKKLTVGVAAVAAAAITLGAGTYAFFSSTVAGPNANAAAGTVVLTQGTSDPSSFTLSGLVPGPGSRTNTLTYTNGGSVPANLNLALAVTGTEDGCTGDEGTLGGDTGTNGCANPVSNVTGGGDLSGLLEVTVTKTVDGIAQPEVYSGPVSNLPLSDSTSAVASGEIVEYTFVYSFPEGGAGDNAAQGDGTTVTTTATLRS